MKETSTLDKLHLDHGSHGDFGDGHCLMEVVAWFADEAHSDQPQCVSPYLRSFGIRLNDRASDERRQRLLRFVPLLVGTAGDGRDEERRWLAADTVTRVLVPKWLDRAGLADHATALRELAPVTDRPTWQASRSTMNAARDAAWQVRMERRRRIREAVSEAMAERGVADAVADAAADAAAAAAAAADAAAAAAGDPWSARYTKIRKAVYARLRPMYDERLAEWSAEGWADAVALYERLITLDAA